MRGRKEEKRERGKEERVTIEKRGEEFVVTPTGEAEICKVSYVWVGHLLIAARIRRPTSGVEKGGKENGEKEHREDGNSQ